MREAALKIREPKITLRLGARRLAPLVAPLLALWLIGSAIWARSSAPGVGPQDEAGGRTPPAPAMPDRPARPPVARAPLSPTSVAPAAWDLLLGSLDRFEAAPLCAFELVMEVTPDRGAATRVVSSGWSMADGRAHAVTEVGSGHFESYTRGGLSATRALPAGAWMRVPSPAPHGGQRFPLLALLKDRLQSRRLPVEPVATGERDGRAVTWLAVDLEAGVTPVADFWIAGKMRIEFAIEPDTRALRVWRLVARTEGGTETQAAGTVVRITATFSEPRMDEVGTFPAEVEALLGG